MFRKRSDKPTLTLRRWYYVTSHNGGLIFAGDIYGSKECPDGSGCITSSSISWNRDICTIETLYNFIILEDMHPVNMAEKTPNSSCNVCFDLLDKIFGPSTAEEKSNAQSL